MLDPRTIKSLLTVLAASPVPIKSISLDKDGGISIELMPDTKPITPAKDIVKPNPFSNGITVDPIRDSALLNKKPPNFDFNQN